MYYDINNKRIGGFVKKKAMHPYVTSRGQHKSVELLLH